MGPSFTVAVPDGAKQIREAVTWQRCMHECARILALLPPPLQRKTKITGRHARCTTRALALGAHAMRWQPTRKRPFQERPRRRSGRERVNRTPFAVPSRLTPLDVLRQCAHLHTGACAIASRARENCRAEVGTSPSRPFHARAHPTCVRPFCCLAYAMTLRTRFPRTSLSSR